MQNFGYHGKQKSSCKSCWAELKIIWYKWSLSGLGGGGWRVGGGGYFDIFIYTEASPFFFVSKF